MCENLYINVVKQLGGIFKKQKSMIVLKLVGVIIITVVIVSCFAFLIAAIGNDLIFIDKNKKQ